VTDNCIYCNEPTAFGSGNFVNRIPADTHDDDGTYRSGFMCSNCQCEPCHHCKELIDDFIIADDANFYCIKCCGLLSIPTDY